MLTPRSHRCVGGLLQRPLPQQIEFSRLNLTYTVMSKRFLKQLVDEKHVDGWDDPRMPTLVGVRRRGYTPEGLRLLIDRVGVSKSDSFIDYSVMEKTQRACVVPLTAGWSDVGCLINSAGGDAHRGGKRQKVDGRVNDVHGDKAIGTRR
jgi:glutamyl/glutaminyl-tRNA synthetase